MQPTGVPLVGGSNPGRANLEPPPARKGTRPGFETADRKPYGGCVTIGPPVVL